MIIDDVTITVAGGNGGDGVVRFSKTKFEKGPTGGNGGKGGDVFVEAVSDLSALRQFRFKKDLKAEDGDDGHFKLNDGKRGKDITLKVPVGTIMHNKETGHTVEFVKVGQTELVATGGRGGKGNFLFRSSTNTTPMESTGGHAGDFYHIRFELKLIADVGFIGLPNVGKSSLLNALTNAQSKVANYPFTTLEPNLGVYYDLILADIPGVIEGAAQGKGLGVKFLQHIERTKELFHLISAESQNPLEDYKTVRRELESYSAALLEKPEYIFLSKRDEATSEKIKEIQQEFKKRGKSATPISIMDDTSMDQVKKLLNELIKQKSAI